MRVLMMMVIAILAACLIVAAPAMAEEEGLYVIGGINQPVQVRVPHLVPIGGKVVWGGAIGNKAASAGQTGGFEVFYLGYDPARGLVHLRSHWVWGGPNKVLASAFVALATGNRTNEGSQDLLIPLREDGMPTTFTLCFAPVMTVPDNYPVIDLTINGVDDHMRLVMGEPANLLFAPPE
ncbi:MAG: hypothetical protein ACM3XZ_08980 [Betaproteobacteria bacterium]